MIASTAVFALAAATGAMAQLSIPSIPAPVQQFVGNLSVQCQQTVLQLAIGSPLSQCLHVQEMLPIITSAISSNGSLIPVLDQLTAIDCQQNGCSNATLTAAYQQIGSGCATDLSKYNVTNSTLQTIFAQYPLARELTCLQTRTPYNGTDAPLNITSPPFNITNGTVYCSSSVLTEVSAIIGQNISIPFFTGIFQAYQNNTLLNTTLPALGSKFKNASALCSDCVFGWADLVGVAYPGVGNVSLSSIGQSNVTINGTNISNITIAQALNSTCAAEGFAWTNNGTLPGTVRLGAYNSSFSYNITAGAISTIGKPSTMPVRRNVADIKARWIGEY